jgi:hypothetical protein
MLRPSSKPNPILLDIHAVPYTQTITCTPNLNCSPIWTALIQTDPLPFAAKRSFTAERRHRIDGGCPTRGDKARNQCCCCKQKNGTSQNGQRIVGAVLHPSGEEAVQNEAEHKPHSYTPADAHPGRRKNDLQHVGFLRPSAMRTPNSLVRCTTE